MIQRDIGACFEIRVDGKTRSHRDRKETAIEAGRYLKQMQPKSEIIVRDLRDNFVTVIEKIWLRKAKCLRDSSGRVSDVRRCGCSF
jgi:hypothetical protein